MAEKALCMSIENYKSGDSSTLLEIQSELTEQKYLALEQAEQFKNVVELLKSQQALLAKIDRQMESSSYELRQQTRAVECACSSLDSIDISARADHISGVQSQLRSLDVGLNANIRLLLIIALILALMLWRLW